MKRLILLVLFAAVAIAPAFAQNVNPKILEKAIEKSDADIQNEKKVIKYGTWTKRGEVYFDSAYEITKDLFVGMERDQVILAISDPEKSGGVIINGKQYHMDEYPYVKIYYAGGRIAAWETKITVSDKAVSEAVAAYAKAYELSEKCHTKVAEQLEIITNYLIQMGTIANELGEASLSADYFVQAYDVQAEAAYGKPAEVDILFSAGYIYTIDGPKNPDSYRKGIEVLTRAAEDGYQDVEDANEAVEDDARGNLYYYLFHCYYGLKDDANVELADAKGLLLEGIQKYPRNSRILEALMTLYTAEQGIGDPRELVDMIETSIQNDPNNADLWFGRGSVYNALKEYDECIKSFTRYTELRPEVYAGYYYLGVFYAHKGDELSEAMNDKSYSSEVEYRADLDAANDMYAGALVPLEKAFEIKPDDYQTVSMLKSLYFRLRDRDGYMDKYTKYNELFKTMEE